MNSELSLENLQTIALEKIAAAERTVWTYLVERAKEDIGSELAAFLDTRGDFLVSAGESRPWRLDAPQATLAIRFPDCTEIVVRYRRVPKGCNSRGGVSDYADFNFEPLNWQGLGKLAVVRYMIDKHQPDEACVVVADPQALFGGNFWYCTHKIENARIVAAKFFKEKVELEEEARVIRQSALDELRNFAYR